MENMSEMLKGVLDGIVLEIISRGETYGYEIVRRLHRLGFDGVAEGTVYAILTRIERGGFVDTEKKPSQIGPPRKFYTLNARGRERLDAFWTHWNLLRRRVDSAKYRG